MALSISSSERQTTRKLPCREVKVFGHSCETDLGLDVFSQLHLGGSRLVSIIVILLHEEVELNTQPHGMSHLHGGY